MIGAAGYVAPRHFKAIKETGNELVAAMDKSDSVGILDKYYPDAAFFTEFERFDRHVELLKRSSSKVDYISICSPNYLHDAHIRFGLRYGADVICEKPIVLNPWNIQGLVEVEKENANRIYTILQLRLHPDIIALKKRVVSEKKKYDIDLTYISSRGKWYYASWKGDVEKSGGIATNIGIHFFDMLHWIFGKVLDYKVHVSDHDRMAGFLECERANIRWFMSINADTLPKELRETGHTTLRSIKIEGEEVEFSTGFENLHTESYAGILNGMGFTLSDALPSIQIAYDIRHAKPIGLDGDYHPLAALPSSKHPFRNQ